MFLQAGGPPADQSLKASWSTSPQGAGSSVVPTASDRRDGWETHDLVGRRDWLRVYYLQQAVIVTLPGGAQKVVWEPTGPPRLLLNATGRVLDSGTGDFVITNSSPMPWMVEFTAVNTGGTSWGQPLVVTITED